MRIEQKLIYPVIIIIITNLLNIFLKQETLLDYIIYTTPFLIATIVLIFAHKKLSPRILSYLLLGFSCLTVLFGSVSDLTSASLLCLSLYLCKHNKIVYINYAVLFLLCIVVKFTLLEIEISHLLTFVSGLYIIIIIYRYYIHDSKLINTSKQIDSKINKSVLKIVLLRAEGFDYSEINDILKLNITDARVGRKVTEEMKRQGFKTKEQLYFYIAKMYNTTPKNAVCNEDGK